MPDHLLDTNVLVVASAAGAEGHPDADVPASPEEALIVHDWLARYSRDHNAHLLLDTTWRIWKEYQENLDEQEWGYLVVREKLATTVRFLDIRLDPNDDAAVLPPDLAAVVHDRKDRKFVAVALADGGRSAIVNATDSDWKAWEPALSEWGVRVLQLLDDAAT